MPDIFDEVGEDLRAERARQFFTRHAGSMIAAVLLIAAAGGGFAAWRAWEARDTAKNAEAFVAAMRVADGPEAGRASAIDNFARIAADSSGGYHVLAVLREAALKADHGDLAGAASLWDQIANDTDADPQLRDIANLTWAMRELDKGDPALIEAHIKPLLGLDNPWHAMAEEQSAMLALRQGKPDDARQTLKQLAGDVTAPDGVRGRANGLLSQLGGSGAS